jgi:hypothetical protein
MWIEVMLLAFLLSKIDTQNFTWSVSTIVRVHVLQASTLFIFQMACRLRPICSSILRMNMNILAQDCG